MSRVGRWVKYIYISQAKRSKRTQTYLYTSFTLVLTGIDINWLESEDDE